MHLRKNPTNKKEKILDLLVHCPLGIGARVINCKKNQDVPIGTIGQVIEVKPTLSRALVDFSFPLENCIFDTIRRKEIAQETLGEGLFMPNYCFTKKKF